MEGWSGESEKGKMEGRKRERADGMTKIATKPNWVTRNRRGAGALDWKFPPCRAEEIAGY